MPTYAQIAVNIPTITGVFDYHLPSDLKGRVGVGALVTVPFGKQTVQGVVVGFINEPSVPETKPVIDVLDTQPVLTSAQIEFAQKLSEATLNPLAEVIGMMLPAGLSQQADVLYSLNPSPFTVGEKPYSEIQKRILDLLDTRGALRGRQLDRRFGPSLPGGRVVDEHLECLSTDRVSALDGANHPGPKREVRAQSPSVGEGGARSGRWISPWRQISPRGRACTTRR